MSADLEGKCRALVKSLKLGPSDAVSNITPLTGGVASDIARLDIGGRTICAKFALAKLKVAEDWRAPVHRNAAEYAWLQTAAAIRPDSAVRLYGRSEDLHGFAMEYIVGEDVYLWKTAMLNGAPDHGEAASVGDMIGAIQAASVREGFDTSPFRNRDDFRALRIEPYITFTAGHHPSVARELLALAEMLYESSQVLVHGDVSPKNILMRTSGPVILDAECATMGDACFDPAFCLNHLLLKAVHLPASRGDLLTAVTSFWNAFAPHVSFEPVSKLQARICRLLPALMLARVDGKSPVEYLDEKNRGRVRRIALELIPAPPQTLGEFADRIAFDLKDDS